MPRRYRIYLLSAKTILSYAKEEGGAVTIALNRDATRQADWWGADRKSRAYLLGKLLEKNPAFMGESVYQEELEAMASGS